jgi:hypothetical protein
MSRHAATIRFFGNVLTVMYGALAVLEMAVLVLFPSQTPGYFAPMAVLHSATAGASWWWTASDGGLR